jgi:glutamyl-tRNA synthetase
MIRVRFAPSPTGYLHVGGARTALFNWLLARRTGGVFILRIEDTDRQRSDDAMVQAIIEGMTWLGMDWDEGPFHQADGIDRHRDDAFRIMQNGRAYRCFCSPDELERRRAAAGTSPEAFRYDRHCLINVSREESDARATRGEPHTLRFHVPEGHTIFHDAVHGSIDFDNSSIEDFIILRTDGTPIYNLAVVSDDVEMRITHVIRGDDHISNTPKQILLYQALGKDVPVFAHVPMILGPDGKRLSKRHGATAVGEYRHQGILADAMVNFLALLGWNPGTEQEIFTTAELIDAFDLDKINKKSAVFDTKKLEWLNGKHIALLTAEQLEPHVRAALATSTDAADTSGIDAAYLRAVIDLLKSRARTIDDIATHAAAYVDENFAYEDDAVAKAWKDPHTAARLGEVRGALAAAEDWSEDALESTLRLLAERLGIGAGKLLQPLRVALLGSAVSPGIFDVLVTLGQKRVLARLDRAMARLSRPG